MKTLLTWLEQYVPGYKKVILFVFFNALLFVGFSQIDLPTERAEASILIQSFQGENALYSQLTEFCGQLTPDTKGLTEVILSDKLLKKFDERKASCTLFLERNSFKGFGFLEQIHYAVIIRDQAKDVVRKEWVFSLPTFLFFWPFMASWLAIFFGFFHWVGPLSFGGLWFILSEANPYQAVRLGLQCFQSMVQTEMSLPGFLCMAFWISAFTVTAPLRQIPVLTQKIFKGFQYSVQMLFGLWNPLVFTLIAPKTFFLNVSESELWKKLMNYQALLLLLSAYLFTISGLTSVGSWISGISAPRYFTFSLIFLIGIKLLEKGNRIPQTPFWELPGIYVPISAVAAVEIGNALFPIFDMIPTLTRVGATMALSVLPSVRPQHFKTILKRFVPLALAILLVSVTSKATAQSGVTQILLTLLNPKLHPHSIAFFLFVLGLILGYVSGQFSLAYFAVLEMLRAGDVSQLARAALLDGVLAGMLLSPLSLYNLFPSTLLDIKLANVLKERWKLLSLPLSMGLLIYAVSSINSVAILRPVTFVFLCLLIYTLENMKFWKLSSLYRAS